MAGPSIVYSFSYTRELNLHRSKEQLEREFSSIKEDTAEFAEFVHRFSKDIGKNLSKYGGIKTVTLPEQIYVVLRDRGLSFPEPVTVVYDENQKLMLVRYVNLLCQQLFPDRADAAVLLTKAVSKKMPLSLDRELAELESEQHIVVPLPYDLEEKALKKWLK